LTKFQAPIVNTWDDLPARQDQIELGHADQGQGSDKAIPDTSTPADTARAMLDSGASHRAIEIEIFGHAGGAAYDKVNDLLTTTTTEDQV